MAWMLNLFMLGKGTPESGDSFTDLSCDGTPGGTFSFAPKSAAGQVSGITYYLKYIARM